MPQLDPATFTSQIFWLFICFAFLVFYSMWITLPQLTQVFNRRFSKIEGIKEQTLILQSQIIQIENEYKQQLMKARDYAHNHIIKTSNELSKFLAHNKHNILTDMKQHLRSYEFQLVKEDSKTRNDIKTVAEDVAQLIINKLISFNDFSINKTKINMKDKNIHDI